MHSPSPNVLTHPQHYCLSQSPCTTTAVHIVVCRSGASFGRAVDETKTNHDQSQRTSYKPCRRQWMWLWAFLHCTVKYAHKCPDTFSSFSRLHSSNMAYIRLCVFYLLLQTEIHWPFNTTFVYPLRVITNPSSLPANWRSHSFPCAWIRAATDSMGFSFFSIAWSCSLLFALVVSLLCRDGSCFSTLLRYLFAIIMFIIYL